MSSTQPSTNSHECTILAVEDNPTSQKVLVSVLEKLGFRHVDIANNGKEAVDQVTRKSYDLIFMDCQMPEMNGFDATIRIRALEKPLDKHTPIVALTADLMSSTPEKCKQAGMDDYLNKPIKKALLRKCIEKWCGITLEEDGV